MSTASDPRAWDRLRETAPLGLVNHLQAQAAAHRGRITFEVGPLVEILSLTAQEVREGLMRAVALELLKISTVTTHAPCGTPLSAADLSVGICPVEDERVVSEDLETHEVFVRDAPPSRDVPWVLCVHGMNTRGAWQEALVWRVATTYHRSVPVYVYKYGRVELGAMIRWRQRQLADRLAETIRSLAGDPQGSRLGPRPDVISHSFGTWMIGHALLRNEDIRLGRVVLVASILRPDFPWRELVDRRQVEAVLVHRGGRDIPVRLAAYMIPHSGPSGHRGFNPNVPVVDRLEPDFSHSAFFDPDRLPVIFASRWQAFLTAPVDDPELDLPEEEATSWTAPPWPLRATAIPLVIVGLIGLSGGGLLAIVIRGIASFF